MHGQPKCNSVVYLIPSPKAVDDSIVHNNIPPYAIALDLRCPRNFGIFSQNIAFIPPTARTGFTPLREIDIT